jgi:hypothetical protein
VLSLIAASIDPTQCLEKGWFCPTPLTGDICFDAPGWCDPVTKTAANISPLYHIDAFDWIILIIYFGILTVLAIYGVYRVKQVIEFWLTRSYPFKYQFAKKTYRTSRCNCHSSGNVCGGAPCDAIYRNPPARPDRNLGLHDSTDETVKVRRDCRKLMPRRVSFIYPSR